MSVLCNSCHAIFEDYGELARHILASKKGHKRGKMWAAKYLNRHVINKRFFENNGCSPLTAEDTKNKQDTKRVLSGQQRSMETFCPKCKKINRAVLEAEYVANPLAWRIGGRLVKLCISCGGV